MLNYEYKKLVENILEEGTLQKGRNGNTITIPNYSFTIDNMGYNNTLKLRKMYLKGIEGEFKTLVDPEPLTNLMQFEINGCHYWAKWADEDGGLTLDYHDQLHPALEDIIQQIKDDPYSRRHVISLWNHSTYNKVSLPCCWHNLTFSVISNALHLTWTQRSVDTMVGLPSDIYMAYLFMKHICKQTGHKIGSCMFSLSNVHIYEKHVDNARLLLSRTEEDHDKPLRFELIS